MAASDEVIMLPTWTCGPQYVDLGRVPGLDEVIVSVPPERTLCNSRQHRRIGVMADVIALFGHFGQRYYEADSFWTECWGRQYPLCDECWNITRAVLADHRPELGVIDTRPESAPGASVSE